MWRRSPAWSTDRASVTTGSPRGSCRGVIFFRTRRQGPLAIDQCLELPAESQRPRIEREVDVWRGLAGHAAMNRLENEAVLLERRARAGGDPCRDLRVVRIGVAMLQPVIPGRVR